MIPQLTVYIRHLLHHIDQLLIAIPHSPSRLPVVFHPSVLQLIPIPALGHDVLQLGYVVKIALEGLLVGADSSAVVQEQHLIEQSIVL